jgi:general secretion pathway protein G
MAMCSNTHFGRSGVEQGFSLLELIIVLVLLGLLAGVVAYRVIGVGNKGKVQIATIQIGQLRQAIENFRFEVGRYPTTDEGLRALVENSGVEGWDGPYLEPRVVPKDPWRREYQYVSPGQHGEYDLWSYGGDGVAGGEGENVDITSWGERSSDGLTN